MRNVPIESMLEVIKVENLVSVIRFAKKNCTNEAQNYLSICKVFN
jgi:hypothetical protein